jgi:hypothetical protein
MRDRSLKKMSLLILQSVGYAPSKVRKRIEGSLFLDRRTDLLLYLKTPTMNRPRHCLAHLKATDRSTLLQSFSALTAELVELSRESAANHEKLKHAFLRESPYERAIAYMLGRAAPDSKSSVQRSLRSGENSQSYRQKKVSVFAARGSLSMMGEVKAIANI